MLRFLVILLCLGVLGGVVATGGFFWVLWQYGRDLPDYTQLAAYEPPVVTRIHAGDGRLLEEYARQKRVFVPVSAIPKRVIHAFLAAEDQNFYHHPGIDFLALVRAVVTNIRNHGTDRRPVGASTITQQVTKNFLLTNEVSIDRKIREAILSFRIERAFTKDRILELYLNEIYLGAGSYGVAAAALDYFNKSLDELTWAEAAYLAALPKAPNNYHPVRDHDAAVARRNWVIGRMEALGYITAAQADEARATPLEAVRREQTEFVRAEYFTEAVRRQLEDMYGADRLYGGGLYVRTTIDPELQDIAREALRDGLFVYDRRHGWRGPLRRTGTVSAALELAQTLDLPPGAGQSWKLAAVTDVSAEAASIAVDGRSEGVIALADLKWGQRWIPGEDLGPAITDARQMLQAGDVIMVEPRARAEDEETTGAPRYDLRQIPDIQGAVVALDPHTGRVLAMVGGFAEDTSVFNRATQARRQPGSAFKPFLYTVALENGFTPSSLILDAPVVIDQGPGKEKWKPSNYSGEHYGPTPLRVGIEKSRNLMTVRLAEYLGMERISRRIADFGITDDLPPVLSMALGAGETTLMDITAGYGMFVNGGKRVRPSLIDRIQDRTGQTIWRHDDRACPSCADNVWAGQKVPVVGEAREQVISPQVAYQMVSILEGVVKRGTARKLRELGRPLGGKTGTTNDERDAWFIGFTPDLVVGVFIGFDEPSPMGRGETGSRVAAPVFGDVIERALAGRPAIPFRIPEGIRLVRIDPETGALAEPGARGAIWEAFRPGTEPRDRATVLDRSREAGDSAAFRALSRQESRPAATVGTGGLY